LVSTTSNPAVTASQGDHDRLSVEYDDRLVDDAAELTHAGNEDRAAGGPVGRHDHPGTDHGVPSRRCSHPVDAVLAEDGRGWTSGHFVVDQSLNNEKG
jgi:hypothetical protein